jgi:hypothetical protein
VQVAVAQSAVVVAGLVIGLALVGRMDLLARMVTLLFLLVAVLNLALWTLYREAPQLYETEAGVEADPRPVASGAGQRFWSGCCARRCGSGCGRGW